MIADTKAPFSYFKLGQKLFQFVGLRKFVELKFKIHEDLWDFKNGQTKIQESFNLIAEWMQSIFDNIFAYYDSPQPIGSC